MAGESRTINLGGGAADAERVSSVRSRVLIVDDTRDAAETLGMLARHLGYRVLVCFSGLTCLERLDEFRPHVILLDLSMPLMDGFDVCREIRRRADYRDTAVIACTSIDRSDEGRRAEAVGFSHYLQKPVPLRVLDEALRRPAA